MNLRTLAVAALCLISRTHAHSWVEQMQIVSDNGSFVGNMGYARGYMARTDAGYNGFSMDYLLPSLTSGRTRIDNTDLLCHPSQRTQNYTSSYPMLQVSPGSYVAMKYLENGHVTQPQTNKGKPQAAGTVFVYGTTQPAADEKITDVLKWTEDGKGGNGRGMLITAQNFDDGRCHQISSSALSVQRQHDFPDRVPDQPTSNVEQWCETDVKIPTSQKFGSKLTLYWLWQWPTAPGADPTYPNGKDEYYSSCMDVSLIAEEVQPGTPSSFTLLQQDPQTTACSDFRSRTAFTQSPSVTTAAAGTGASATSAPAYVAAGSTLSSAVSTPLHSKSNTVPYVTTATVTATAAVTATMTATTFVTVMQQQSAVTHSLIPSAAATKVPITSTLHITSTTTAIVTATAIAAPAAAPNDNLPATNALPYISLPTASNAQSVRRAGRRSVSLHRAGHGKGGARGL